MDMIKGENEQASKTDELLKKVLDRRFTFEVCQAHL